MRQGREQRRTYKREIAEIISYLYSRGEENTWIVKPWNLGRGLDIHITDNLNQVIRLAQAGPKVTAPIHS